jgi:hypothetical protein
MLIQNSFRIASLFFFRADILNIQLVTLPMPLDGNPSSFNWDQGDYLFQIRTFCKVRSAHIMSKIENSIN